MTDEQIAHDIAVALAIASAQKKNTSNTSLSAVTEYFRIYKRVLSQVKSSNH